MSGDIKLREPLGAPVRDTGALLLAVGGLTAAFGAASCCALPILLGSLGLGGAWLAAVAWIAAPHRIALLTAAVICLAGGAGVFLWRRRAAACTACSRPASVVLVAGVLAVGSSLTLLGYMYG